MVRTPIPVPYIPARATAGLRDPIELDGAVIGDTVIPSALHNPDGTLPPAVLGLLADGCLGVTLVRAAPAGIGMVTAHLHLEFTRAVPAGLSYASCTARLRALDASYGLAEGTITDEGGQLLAAATLGGVLVPAPAAASSSPSGTTAPPPAERPDVDRLLGTAAYSVEEHRAEVTFCASPILANIFGMVHGGMGALMGARTIELAVAAGYGSGTFRMADLRAVFPRSVPADGGDVRCAATVLHRGRRLVVARAELLGPDGRVAVTVDATYVGTEAVDLLE